MKCSTSLQQSPLTNQGVPDALNFVLFDNNKTDILAKGGTHSLTLHTVTKDLKIKVT